ncbi:MAG: GntR family transcriptional regulator [Gemmatimonadaceae bacterium]|nr:GntR family transcriptional regulator [Gemmatimonadaceae bacterium]NUR36229.1 GntR family transcriptional regulator [Gemmatimonadaceae bacterium]NUS34750.1 GntR family transcriptional regulator [Gemmatimonadaceae bacterium]NUS46449.1 GntR family transcriptional regulator [Gemmatimonadaceae bacterium]
MKAELSELVDMLRGRVLRALQASTLAFGDRLPSARDLAQELELDHRLVLAAYRALADEGLVELRQRGGIYVASRPASAAGVPPLPATWFAEVLAQGLTREIPATELGEWLRRCTETLRLRVAVVASTSDQGAGLCRELADDFGFDTDCIPPEELRGADRPPLGVRRADLIVTTRAHAEWVRALGAELRKDVYVVEVRPDLVRGEWSLLFRRPVYAVVADVEFGEMLRQFFAEVPGSSNLRILVLGRDDLEAIPDDAPTYVTQQARAQLGGITIRGRILPAARTISPASARALLEFVVRSNIEALQRGS